MADENLGLKFMEEEMDFMIIDAGDIGGCREPGLRVIICGESESGKVWKQEIGYICKDGSFTIEAYNDQSGHELELCSVRLTRAQWKEIDRKADEFERKCDVEALITACEEVMNSKQFPMVRGLVKDPPSETPVVFNKNPDGDVSIVKDEHVGVIGIIRTQGLEFGKLHLLYCAMHTGLTEADKAAIIAKCREIVESHKIE